MSDRQLIFGLGTGRCGTKSLAAFLNCQHDTSVTHQRLLGRFLPWEPNIRMLARYVAQVQRQSMPARYHGNVSFYWLRYVGRILKEYDPEARFICLQRNRGGTVDSFLRGSRRRNKDHWTKDRHERGCLVFPHADKAFPKYDGTIEEALGCYWDEYYSRARHWAKKYPTNFRIFPLSSLNNAAGQTAILDWAHIPAANRIHWGGARKANRGPRWAELEAEGVGLKVSLKGKIKVTGGGHTFVFGPLARATGKGWTKITNATRRLAEIEMLEYIQSLKIPGHYVDIGAHVGNHTAFFSLCCPSTGVTAVEADIPRWEALQETIALNKLEGVVPLNCGASARRGYMVQKREGAMFFRFAKEADPESLSVEARTVDDMVRGVKDIGLIKIDTEGTEAAILNGAARTLAKHRPHVIVETFTDQALEKIAKILGPGYERKATFNATPTHHFAPVEVAA